MSPKILLFGSGAIGTIYAYLLDKAGCNVTTVCRSNYEAASKEGFHIDSDLWGKGLHFHPNRVVRTIGEANDGPYDYLIITTKVLPSNNTPSLIAPAVTRGHTTIVLIQNGIQIEDEYLSAFPSNPLLSCVVYLPVTQITPGRIQMGGNEMLQVGTHPPSKSSPQANQLISLLKKAGSNTSFHENIQPLRWEKLLLNIPWNPICALTLSRDTAFLQTSDFTQKVMEDLLAEVVSIAQALGHTSITAQSAEQSMARITSRVGDGKKGIEPSMLVDQLQTPRPRALEVESILGNTLRIAKKLPGIQCPRLEMLYVLTKALDESNQGRKPGQSLDGEDMAKQKGL